MSCPIQFHLARVPFDSLRVVSFEGEERLGRPYRFVLDLETSDPDLPLETMLGCAAVLTLGPRTLHGIVAEIEQGDEIEGAYGCRVVLVPRVWSASLGSQSRVFQDLRPVDAALAVLGEIGLSPELRLTRDYAPQSHIVQYRESGLDFVSRLLESEGIATHFIQGEGSETLVFSDGNEGFRDRVAATMRAADGDAVAIESFRGKRRMTARSVFLHDEEGSDAPIQADAVIDENGVGTLVEHGLRLGSPARAARLASQWAEAQKAEGGTFAGRAKSPVSAGQIVDLSGHARSDFNASYLVTSVRHRLAEGAYRSEFEAISATTVYRPPCTTQKPRIEGLMPARVETSPARSPGEAGPYRVRMPFDLGGSSEGGGSPPMPLLSPDPGMRFQVGSGSSVMLGFVDGDPERPVIAGAVPRAFEGAPAAAPPGGVIIETSASSGRRPPETNGLIDGRLSEQRQLADDSVEEHTGDYIRFASPHGRGNKKWSYLRYGKKTVDNVASGSETFNETVLDGEFTAKHFNAKGQTADSGEGYTWSFSDLGEGSTYRTDENNRKAHEDKAYFPQNRSSGVFDYTDGNRTIITDGNHQSVTTGNRTDVILGDYRVVIPARTSGIYDADDYTMRFRHAEGSWRKSEISHVKSDSWKYGDQEEFYLGFDSSMKVGTSAEATFGLNLEASLGFKGSFNAGFGVSVDLGPSMTYSWGGKYAVASEHEIEASKSIMLRIPMGTLTPSEIKMRVLCASYIALATSALLSEGAAEFAGIEVAGRGGLFGLAGASFLAAVVADYMMKGRPATPMEPSLVIDPTKIELSIGTTGIKLTPTGITIHAGPNKLMLDVMGGAKLDCVTESLAMTPMGTTMEATVLNLNAPKVYLDGDLTVIGDVLSLADIVALL